MLQRSDAWLILALLYAGAPADRERIIQVGNGIQHAIFTEEEREGGLTRLQAAGYVTEHEGRFQASPTVREWFAAVSPPRARIHRDLERVERYLEVHESR